MSNGVLPKVIDSLAFAKAGVAASGFLDISALPRLVEASADSNGKLACAVSGRRDNEGKHWLLLEISGAVVLTCQRCLEKLNRSIEVSTELLLVPHGVPWPEDELANDDYDAIAADDTLNLMELIEDEVLLVLPISPMHDKCSSPVQANVEQGPSPFAVLTKLMKGV